MKQWLLVVFLVVTANYINAQHSDQTLGRKAPLVSEPTDVEVPFTGETIKDVLSIPELNGWKAVDTMQNTYGTALSSINPLAYDPFSNVVALVHRASTTYGSSSGELWYNISTNRGGDWSRTPIALNYGFQKYARFPSMAISNVMNSTIIHTTGIFSWAELYNGAFGRVGFGADQPLGAGTPLYSYDYGRLYSSQVPCWTITGTEWLCWASDNQSDASIKFFRTADFVSIDTVTPPAWSSSVFQNNGNQLGGGASALDGTLYFGVVGSFLPPDTMHPIVSGWFPGVSRSTDHGTTWEAFEVVDFRQIPELSAFDRLYDYLKSNSFVDYHCDIHVDKYGQPHLLISLTDTLEHGNSGTNALVEIYKTPGGKWDGKVIYSGIPDYAYRLTGPALGQMGPSGYLAMDKTRNIMVAQWVTPVEDDSICDILISWRMVDDTRWSAPINITNTTGMNENNSHLAPFLGAGAIPGTITAFSLFVYPVGYTGYYPNGGTYDLVPSILYAKPTNIALSPVPFAPSHLIAANDGPKRISLHWVDNALNETGYIVERKTGDSTSVSMYEVIATQVANTTAFIDTLVSDTTEYSYRVKAVNDQHISGYSNQTQIVSLIPVELVSFSGSKTGSTVTLKWETRTEKNNRGFQIERRERGIWIEVGFVKGNGTTTESSTYTFSEQYTLRTQETILEYRLRQLDYNGMSVCYPIIKVEILNVPFVYELSQNFPNPFNPVSTITVMLPESMHADVILYNMLGEKVKTLHSGMMSTGVNQIELNASDLSSGLYYYTLKADGFTDVKKCMVLK